MPLSLSRGNVADDARRLTSCIIGANDPGGNLAHEAVSAVEMHLLQLGWPVGESLGALPQVQKRLGLGRPSFREAMIILEARGILNVRRGPGGGLFVAAPTSEEVVEAMLIYLTLSGASRDCIQEFRLLVWRMVAEAAIDRGLGAAATAATAGEWGFAVDLAHRVGNPAMVVAAQIAEMLVRACQGRAAPTRDLPLERAMSARDTRRAFARLEDLAVPLELTPPLIALEALEHSPVRSGRKTALSLAAKMIQEMIHRPEQLEAEAETAERLGCSDVVVRQARRILQDFGAIRCQRGRKGALWESPASPAGVIRLLAPCFIASGMSVHDNAEAAMSMARNGPRLAAGRAGTYSGGRPRVLASFAYSLELIDLIRVENLLLELACNPLLSIMTRSLGLANLASPRASVSRQRRAEIVAINHRILRAIEACDAESAGNWARAKGDIQQSEIHYRKLA